MNDFNKAGDEGKINRPYKNPNSRLWVGAILVIIGAAALAKSVFLDLPYWLFTWPMILIIIGLFDGVKHNFRSNTWWILWIIGGYFLMDDIFPDVIDRRYFWPVAIIIVGIIIMLRPKRQWDNWCDPKSKPPGQGGNPGTDASANNFSNTGEPADVTNEEVLDAVAIFGGVKKSVYSKNFKGGKISCVFGGGEINLLHADFTGTAVLDVTTIFGGCTIILPAHWQVRVEPASIFGGVDDKRSQPNVISYDKTLIISGTILFGGIEIKSY
jgi:predicted membrane protein